MTAKKKLKARIRERMQQTGESYSTARMRLLAENPDNRAETAETADNNNDQKPRED